MESNMFYNDCPKCLRDYLNYLTTVKNRSELTVSNYYLDIRLFLRYLMQENNLTGKTDFFDIKIAQIPEELIKSVTLEDILGFLSFSATVLENNAKSRARKAVAIRRFFRYLTINKQWFNINPAENLEMPSPKQTLPKHLTVEQATTLLNTCSEFKDWMDYRDYAIITLFLNCGMRLSELVRIDVTDIKCTQFNNENTFFIKILGKGSKERIVYLNEACVKACNDYIQVRPESKDKAMFLSKQHKRISNRRIQQMLEEKLQLSGLSGMGFSVHKLRHTAATLMYQNGVDVRVLKDVLGHESLDTTQIYTHVANEQMRRAINQNPLGSITGRKKV